MKSFTLDWNCPIAAEKGEPEGNWVRKLVDAQMAKAADVAFLATSASENPISGAPFAEGMANFKRRVALLDWADMPILPTPAVWDMTFWDESYWTFDSYDQLLLDIWKIMFPAIQMNDPTISNANSRNDREHRKWRNAWCDVHSMISHIDQKRNVFVTINTSDFQRHRAALRTLGCDNILLPSEAVSFIV